MDTLIQRVIADVEKRGLALILTEDPARRSRTELIASLLLKGPILIVSGDEWLPAFELPRLIRGQCTGVRNVMDRLYTVRASTCHRLFDSLATTPSQGEPILVMSILHTFYDADVPLRTRLFRLRGCCRELARLALYRPVMVMTQENEGEDFEKFLPVLWSIADRCLTLEADRKTLEQPVLF